MSKDMVTLELVLLKAMLIAVAVPPWSFVNVEPNPPPRRILEKSLDAPTRSLIQTSLQVVQYLLSVNRD